MSRLTRFSGALALFLSFVVGAGGAWSGEPPLRLGFLPYIAPSALIERYTPLSDYLGREMGREARIVIAKNYEEHIWNIRDGKVDIAFLGAATYVKLVEKNGPQRLLARYQMNGQPTFHGIIIVPGDSRLTTLSQLRGKRMAFGDPRSTLSHLVPRAMLLQAGVDVRDLKKHKFLGSHDNVVMGVMMGRYDAGGIAEEVFVEHKDRGIRALAASTPLSTHVFIAAPEMPEADAARVKSLLEALSSHSEGRRIIQSVGAPVTGFESTRDSDYDGMREVMKTLRAAGVEP